MAPSSCKKTSGLSGFLPSTGSNIEPVASVMGTVASGWDGPNKAGNLPWPSQQLTWAGLQDRYFALLIFPGETEKANGVLPFTTVELKFAQPGVKTSIKENNFPVLWFRLPITSIAPGEQICWEFLIFSGPKSKEALASGIVNLSSLLFPGLWGWMRWICFGLLGILGAIHAIIPDWGWTIIILALIVRICLSPLANIALKSQQRFVDAQKLLLPELKEIKKNFKGGEQSEKILQLYKKHNVSPFAGLKPLFVVLIQLPILIALFHVLGSAYELHDARFLWINTLSEPDKLFCFGFNIPLLGRYFNLLPVIMAIVTLLSFKLAPAPTAEKKEQGLQNIFLIAMTLMFFFLFYSFPAGMVLYWTFANFFHIIQHRLMTFRMI